MKNPRCMLQDNTAVGGTGTAISAIVGGSQYFILSLDSSVFRGATPNTGVVQVGVRRWCR